MRNVAAHHQILAAIGPPLSANGAASPEWYRLPARFALVATICFASE
jgi:hypothetical protein